MKASVLVLLLVFTLHPIRAQDHQHTVSVATNGFEHPELVSDSDAYRHFFILAAMDSRQLSGLLPADRIAAMKILSDFKAEWEGRIAEYNARATELNNKGQRSDIKPFLAARDTLGQQTRGKLVQALSENGVKTIDASVKAGKGRMGVPGRPQ